MGAGNLAGNASLSAGALSALGVGSVAGAALGGLGVISSIADLTRALDESSTSKETNVSGWSAGSKLGMVGSGAIAGAALGSIIPGLGNIVGGLIGAGVGGLGALFAGDKVGRSISDFFDGTGAIKATVAEIEATGDAFMAMQSKGKVVDDLVEQYEHLESKISRGKMSSEELAQAQTDLQETVRALAEIYPDLITQYDVENGKLEEKLGLIQSISEAEREKARRDAEMTVYEGQMQLPNIEDKIRGSQGEHDAAIEEYEARAKEIEDLAEVLSKFSAASMFRETKGYDSEEYKNAFAEYEEALHAHEQAYGKMYGAGIAGASADYESLVKSAGKQLEKAEAAQTELEEALSQYQEIYNAKIQLAINPENLDLSAIESKASEITKLTEEIQSLNTELSSKEKGSEEYEQTAQKIADAKTRQEELTEEVEKFREPLTEVLDTITEINNQFSLLPDEKKITITTVGLGNTGKVLGYESSSKTETNKSFTSQIKSPMELAQGWMSGLYPPGKGFASGTLHAPPGTFWVGEEGPELMRFRGGERVYNTTDSMRIAAENARSTGRGTSESTGGIQINLGGISVSIDGGGGDSGDIMDQLQSRLPELGNQLCAMIATQLSRSYANLPTNAVEGI